MKKLLFSSTLVMFFALRVSSQCAVSNCSTYAVQPITFTTFPTTGATNVALSDDQLSAPVPIGFTFNFFCNAYTQVEICSNGFITFLLGTGNPAYPGSFIPNAATPNNQIDIFWNDLYPPGNGTISYITLGTAPNRMFVVTYSNIPYCCTASAPYNTGQIVLYETTNNIEIYSNTSGNGNNCTQGIENLGGTIAYTVPGRNGVPSWAATNSAYLFTGVVPTAPSPIIGGTTACIGVQQNFSILPSTGATSYNWSFPAGWTGSSTTSAVTATVGASGSVSVTATYTCGTSVPTVLNFSTIPAPVVSILSVSPSLVCSGKASTVNTSGAIGYTLNPGGNTSGPPFNVIPSVTTVYTLQGIDGSNCVSVNNPTMIVYVNPSPTVTINSGAICLGQTFNFVPNGADTYTISSVFFAITPTSPGISNYTLVGTNLNGCVSNQVISSVTVNALPNLIAAATQTNVCRDESVNLNATGANTYSWSTGGSGAVVTLTPQSSGYYYVTGVGANSCIATATVYVKVSSCVGLNENIAAESIISIYPNPSSGEFTIKTKAATVVVIYDLQGKLIYNQKLSEGVQTINLTQYASGEYLLKATQGDTKQSFTLIKQ